MPKPPSVRKGDFRHFAMLSAAIALSVAAPLRWLRTAADDQRPPTRPIEARLDQYASSSTCEACHPDHDASWRRSFHRTMTQIASPDRVVADFDEVQVNAVPGRPMLLHRRGRELWAEFDDPDWNGRGDAPPRIERRVALTTGSHNQQIYWYATGHDRLLGQLPAIQLVNERRWIPRRAATLHPSEDAMYSETGAWNSVCVACHTTSGRPRLDAPLGSRPLTAQGVDTIAAEFGIACEACHGPSGGHARENRSPLRRYALHLTGGHDATTVQPLRLDPQRSSQVCGQCHALWEFYDRGSEREANAHGLPYRPGDELAATRFVVQPTRNLGSGTMQMLLQDDPRFVSDVFWSDGMVRATGREFNGLVDSPCYKKATDPQRTLTCFSCHTMHQTSDDRRSVDAWADDQLSPRGLGDAACLDCHPKYRTNVTAHTKHAAASSGSGCYNCHMPYTTYGLLKTIRSHQISSPSAQATLDTGRPNACNLCHLDKTLAWTSAYLTQWYGAPAPANLSEDDRTIASSLLTLLAGDAGQRAIVAQSMGWGPAQHASGGDNWMAPYLALLLTDSYDAVRYIAGRSLRTLPGLEALPYDFVARPDARAEARVHALELWRGSRTVRRDAALLVNAADGTFNAAAIDRVMRQRNNRRVYYRE
jgi:Cytochrome c552